jgi:sulfoxide reductase heme-binding subunit YedZ
VTTPSRQAKAGRTGPMPADVRRNRQATEAPGKKAPPAGGEAKAVALRHLVVGFTTLLLTAGFWFTRLDWAPDMRTWRAFGDAAVVLLFVSLAIGPAARLWRPAGRLVRWRRETGVWCAVASLVHAVLIFHGWVRWSLERLWGFEFVAQLNRTARLEPGFGLANLIGLVALAWLLVLAATSSDRMVRLLGPAAWKWLHHGAYVAFYLSVLHGAYFLYLHYSLSFHKAPAPPNWFRVPLVVMGFTVVSLELAAFVRTAQREKRRQVRR